MRANFILAVASLVLISTGCCCQNVRRAITIKRTVCRCAACSQHSALDCTTCGPSLNGVVHRPESLRDAKRQIGVPVSPIVTNRTSESVRESVLEGNFISTGQSTFADSRNQEAQANDQFEFDLESISNRRIPSGQPLVSPPSDEYYAREPVRDTENDFKTTEPLPTPPSQRLAPQVQDSKNLDNDAPNLAPAFAPKVAPIETATIAPKRSSLPSRQPVQFEAPLVAPPAIAENDTEPIDSNIDNETAATATDEERLIQPTEPERQPEIDRSFGSVSNPAVADNETSAPVSSFNSGPLSAELNDSSLLPPSDSLLPPSDTPEPVTPQEQVEQEQPSEILKQDQTGIAPIILHARSRQQPEAEPATHDPKFGLPTTDQVEFSSLPQIRQPISPSPTMTKVASEETHSTSHSIHQHQLAHQQEMVANREGGMMLVVYRDEKGRLFLAPPAAHHAEQENVARLNPINIATAPPASLNGLPTAHRGNSTESFEQEGSSSGEFQYYRAGQPMLRLKAIAPISTPTPQKSKATILFRDTVIVDGTHLLDSPEIDVLPVGQMQADGKPSINHQQLREALLRLTPSPLNTIKR